MPHCLHHNQYPLWHYQPLIAAAISFSAYICVMEMYIKTCPMAPIRRRSFETLPNEATMAEDKGVHGDINAALDIQ
jgi:hypothetical protein